LDFEFRGFSEKREKKDEEREIETPTTTASTSKKKNHFPVSVFAPLLRSLCPRSISPFRWVDLIE